MLDFDERTGNVYENKGQVQKVAKLRSLVAQTAGSAVCGFSTLARGDSQTANTAVRATPRSREQSQNVYENKEQVQKVAKLRSLVAQTAGSAVRGISTLARGDSQTANTAVRATPKSREQSQNVYENKEQVQKVAKLRSLAAQTADPAVCGFSTLARTGRGPQTRRSALRQNHGNKARMFMKTKDRDGKPSLPPSSPRRRGSTWPRWIPAFAGMTARRWLSHGRWCLCPKLAHGPTRPSTLECLDTWMQRTLCDTVIVGGNPPILRPRLGL